MARDANDEPLLDLARGFRKRTLVTAKLAAKLGLKAATRTFGGAGSAPDEARAIEAAQRLVSQMGELKGLVMKVGQMASYLPGALPPAAQNVLAQLQAESKPMAYERMAEVVREQLGAEPDALFEGLERVPFAAASIGQVHRARHAGRSVAVKVQYPGVEELLRSDLHTISLMARLSTVGQPTDGKALAEELGARILEECNYAREAESQRLFIQLLSRIEGASAPAVVSERSARRVLTTELVEGRRFADFATLGTPSERNRAGEIIFDACMGILFRHCIFNGDPHPGNYLFGEHGSVVFLDFGCVRRFDPEMIAEWKRVALTVLDDDRAGFVERWPRLGFVPRPKGFDWDYQWEAMQHLYRPLKTPGFTFTDAYVEESYSVQVFDNPNKLRIRMGPEWLLLNRLQWGLYAILAKLGAAGDWPGLFRSAAQSPTMAM